MNKVVVANYDAIRKLKSETLLIKAAKELPIGTTGETLDNAKMDSLKELMERQHIMDNILKKMWKT